MNPADLYRVDSIPSFDGTDGLSGKGLPGSASLSGKNTKLSFPAPRIDSEQIYTSLKAAVGDNWSEYKAALGLFVLGKLNQTELTHILTPILTSSSPLVQNGVSTIPSAMHLHNTFLTTLYANALFRDTPPESTAPWVANEGPSASSKSAHASGANDKIDERNRREVMALSARDRRRIKSVKDTPAAESGLAQAKRYQSALDAQPSALLYNLGTSSAPLGKTNTDLEIRRRFALALASESQEFPSRENISARIEPICYEEGLVGAGAPPAVSELLETAVETYVKELVGTWLGATRSEADGLVQPARYKRRLRAEERAAEEEATVVRDVLGRLPVETEALGRRTAIGVADLRLATRLDAGMRHAPFFGSRWMEEAPEAEAEVETNGVNGHAYDHMDVDDEGGSDEDWGWAGTGDRGALMDVLAETLAVG